MTFRLLHTSDWHLGQHFYGKSRRNEHQQFLNWLLLQVAQEKIDAVVVAGDIFDTGTPPSYAREMYFDFIVKMHQLKCQLIVLAGNHDSVAMLTESKRLLSHLSCQVIPNVIAVNDEAALAEQVILLKDHLGQDQAVICAVPFIRPRDIISSKSGQSTIDKQQSLQQAISEHYQAIFKHAQKIANNALPIIATGHLTTVGVSVTESVRDIYIGTLEAFPASEFPKADYIALGHIHRSQKVAKTEYIRYSGSPIPLSFDEAKQDKKVFIVHFCDASLKRVSELTIPTFQPMVMLKSNLAQLEVEISELLANENLSDGQKIWLDIEIDSSQYLSDLTARIEQIVKDKPIDVLLVRRAKKQRQLMQAEHDKTTLNELNLTDVFAARLAEEAWQTDDELTRKTRLEQLFLQTVEQVTTNKHDRENHELEKEIEQENELSQASNQDSSELHS